MNVIEDDITGPIDIRDSKSFAAIDHIKQRIRELGKKPGYSYTILELRRILAILKRK